MKMLDLFSLILQSQYYDIYSFMSIISKKYLFFLFKNHVIDKLKSPQKSCYNKFSNLLSIPKTCCN
ncbi:hypothetical protein CN360_27935 [Bacillus cereus]|uniref:Uncharacterized protein n=1 Tax=Bacillus cereus TaxID=1396 RepID=A0A9X6VUR1_BACCE|nr:hypothetical protein BK713_08255 [Bacillus thuringiensis serovar jinghongiensis]OTX25279.1 hypothetical protein BK715_00780 [Bacillus thuringiensis serovar japonensis]PDZ78356.1 hypothetical protein CON31_17490 [Bacillus cereus]PEC02081.1 hypothetical protein COM98_26095 [Bacillus cereus]PEW35529.1 hypothetical protein CN441_03385 [Bacillus cereus]